MRVLKAVRFAFLLATIVYSEVHVIAQQHSPDNISIQQCEPDSCGTWSFQGNQGEGEWITGPTAKLTLEHLDSTSISISREDTGKTRGLTGHYTGTRKADHIEGSFTWSWPNGPVPAGTVHWIGVIGSQSRGAELPPPKAMAICEDAADGCSNWIFSGRDGYGNWSNCVAANLSILHFDERNIEIRRIDATGSWRGLSALYAGTITGNTIQGFMSWVWEGHDPFTIGTVPWHAIIGMAQKDHDVSNESAMACGLAAQAGQDYEAASHWYLYGERRGDVRASVRLGILLMNGAKNIPQDYPNALKRFEYAGSKGDILGMKKAAFMYEQGLGIAKDPARIKYWSEKLAAREEPFAAICSNPLMFQTMTGLQRQVRDLTDNFWTSALSAVIEEGMGIDNNDVHVISATVADVVSNDDFQCDGIFGQKSGEVITARPEASADAQLAALATNSLISKLRPTQEYHIKGLGQGRYRVILEAIGSENQANGLRGPIPHPFSEDIKIP